MAWHGPRDWQAYGFFREMGGGRFFFSIHILVFGTGLVMGFRQMVLFCGGPCDGD